MAKTYSTERLNIYWKPEICQHAGECVRGLPNVFDPHKRPWITPENATDEEIAKVIDRCPSGALTYEWKSEE